MSDVAKALAALPDDARCSLVVGSGELTVGDLRRALHATSDEHRVLSTTQAATEYGMSSEWWSRRAVDVPGAWQEKEGAPWYLPARGCRAYLASRSGARQKGKRGLRGPNKKASDTPPARARAATASEGPVVERGPAPVEPTAGGDRVTADAA